MPILASLALSLTGLTLGVTLGTALAGGACLGFMAARRGRG